MPCVSHYEIRNIVQFMKIKRAWGTGKQEDEPREQWRG
jgi:hypothetical protein